MSWREGAAGALKHDGWIVFLLLLAALTLRAYNLNWDDGHLFHPDERHILMTSARLALPAPLTLDNLWKADSPLNPQSFVYGSLVFYLVSGISHLLAIITSLTGSLPGQLAANMDNMRLVGRALSALFDTGSVLLTYFLGRSLYGRRVGLLAAAFVAFSAIGIQLSHFYAADTLLTFLVLTSALISVRLTKRVTVGTSLVLGALIGLALATKFSALPIVAMVAAVHVLRLHAHGKELNERQVRRSIFCFVLTLLAVGVVFVATQPYVLVDFQNFVRQLGEQSNMVRGVADFPYTRQYANRPAYLYFIQNLVVWSLGLPLGLAVVAGWLLVLGQSFRKPIRAHLLLLSWVMPYFLITGSFHAKFLRYLLPIVPFLCIFGAYGLLVLFERTTRYRAAVLAAIALVIVTTGFYAIAFDSIYSRPHTALEASRWIYQNVPKGSAIATEHWEEGMPVPLIDGGIAYSAGSQGYRTNSLNLYEDDTPAKLNHIVQQLTASDYIVFFSNRLYGTIPRLPERYPMTKRYYELLFGEKLGFELEASFASYPNLLGVSFVDDTLSEPGLPVPARLAGFLPSPVPLDLGRADESVTVYDHPKVLVFKKHRQLSQQELRSALGEALAQRGSPRSPDKSLLLTPERQRAMIENGTFAALFDRDGVENRFPLLFWVLALEIVGLAAAPICLLVFSRLSDGGYAFAKTVGMLFLAYVTWLLASTGLAANTRSTVIGVLAFLLLMGLALAALRRRRLAEVWRERKGVIMLSEAIFWAAFLLFLIIRLANPDIWHPYRGGEKPMEMAYLTAVIKSVSFPPYDPWFAGGYINYYYFGQVIVGTFVKLTGVLPTVAFNLAIPTLFAQAFAGAFVVTHNLVAGNSGLRARPLSLLWGAVGATFALILGNLGGTYQIVDQLARIGAGASRAGGAPPDALTSFVAGLWRVVGRVQTMDIPTDWYWASTRVIKGTINEFPFFSFLFADLHAHLIAMPLALLALALAVNFLKRGDTTSPHSLSQRRDPTNPLSLLRKGEGEGEGSPAACPSDDSCPSSALSPYPSPRGRGDSSSPCGRAELVGPRAPAGSSAFPPPLPLGEGWGEGRSLLARLSLSLGNILAIFLSGITLGALYTTNSWDFPTYALIISLALLIPWYSRQRPTFPCLARSLAVIAAIVATAIVAYLPFHDSFRSFYSGVEPFPDKSGLVEYLGIHGLFIYILASFLVVDLLRQYGRGAGLRWLRLWLSRPGRTGRLLVLSRALVRRRDYRGVRRFSDASLFAAFVLFVLVWFGLSLIALLLALLLLVGLLLTRRRRSPMELFVLCLVAVSLLLGLGVEFFAIKGDIGRMNTVFKVYLQVWILWSIASAVALSIVVEYFTTARLRVFVWPWLAGLIVLVMASGVYPVVATRARVSDRFDTSLPPTLDGTLYAQKATFGEGNKQILLAPDLKAIRWLQDNVSGSPVVLEAQAPPYRWGARVSVYTGLPTVIGWDWHQKQQRWGYQWMIDQRVTDVRAMYSEASLERRLDLLRYYGVSYVYIGELERLFYPPSQPLYDAMIGAYVDVAYDEDGVRIYRVRG
ncbi:MAG: glycosyltransferase family 39 protein [Chloroflexi bacterium]|nr:glycosyltransferase family 39 protein [Chloroflexota bacterium]